MATWVQRIGGLSPLGPIFGKELRATARRKRTYLLRFLYLAVLLLVMLLTYTANRYDYGYQSVAMRAQKNAQMGEAFFGVFCFFSMAAMAIVGPILTATAINSERLHKTLPVLLMTPITAWQIISGKLFSRLLIALTLLALSLPVLSVVRLLGGVEIMQVVAAISICVCTVLVTASFALFLSTLMNRAYAVILLSYAFFGIVWLFVPFTLSMLMVASGGPQRMWLFTFMSAWHLPMSMALVAISERPPFSVLHWGISCGGNIAFSAVMVLLSSLILRRMARKEHEGGGKAVAPPELMPVAPIPQIVQEAGAAAVPPPPAGHPAPLPYQPRRKARPERTVGDNPVLWREIRRPLMARRWQSVVGLILVLCLMIGTYLMLLSITGSGRRSALVFAEAQIPFAIIFCIVMNVLFCVISGTAIAQEKESDTWTLLLATPMSARRIVLGKFAGLAARMLWPSILVVGHFLLFAAVGIISIKTFVILIWLLFTTNVVWLATGLYLSLRVRWVTMAIILNLLGPVVAFLLPLVGLAILGELFDRSGNWPELVGLYTPYALMTEAIDKLNPRQFDSFFITNSFQGHNSMWLPFFHSVDPSNFYEVVAVQGLAYLAATAGVVAFTIRRFDRIVGRARSGEEQRQGFEVAIARQAQA